MREETFAMLRRWVPTALSMRSVLTQSDVRSLFFSCGDAFRVAPRQRLPYIIYSGHRVDSRDKGSQLL